MENFGIRLKNLRQGSGLSIKELASKVSVNALMIKDWENNKRVLTIGRLIRIAQYFNVTVDYLVGL